MVSRACGRREPSFPWLQATVSPRRERVPRLLDRWSRQPATTSNRLRVKGLHRWPDQGRQPVLVMGMHRSGTSLVVSALESMGVFMGAHQEVNREAKLFLRLNRWMFALSGATWDAPGPMRAAAADPTVRTSMASQLSTALASPQLVRYLGVPKYLRLKLFSSIPEPWGWKDPRNTYTLPVWRELFPLAKVIHVRRHGVDVACSLLERRKRILAGNRERLQERRLIPRYRDVHVPDPALDLSFQEAFALWMQYVDQAESVMGGMEDLCLDIRYEDLVMEQEVCLRRLAHFCGLDEGVARPAPEPDRSRCYAFRDDPALVALAGAAAEALQSRGY